MFKGPLLGKRFFALLFFFLCFLPTAAKADPADQVTFNFTATAICPICFPVDITGAFTFDTDTDSVVGPWSFSAFGQDFMSSSDPGSSVQVFNPAIVFFDPNTNFAGSDFSVLLFSLPPFQGVVGAIDGINSCEVGCNLFVAPEPPPVVLLGAGILTFGLLAMRRRDRSLRARRIL